MQVLAIASDDADLVDHVRGVVYDAIQAYSASIEITEALPDTPEQRLSDQQLFLWRGQRSVSIVADMIADPSTPRLCPSDSIDNLQPNNAAPETDPTAALVKRLHKRDRKIKALTATIEDLQTQLQTALARVEFVEHEQEQFFEDVQHMKDAYDKLHASHQKLLWEYLPAKDPAMCAIPRLSTELEESEATIGPYALSDVLGYGQYATVFASQNPDPPHERLAVKAIDKGKLLDLVTLHRVNSEIAALQDPALQHGGLMALRYVYHTHRHIYLVTERGGKDLFDYFGTRDNGVAEETIKSLMFRVALAVQTLHRHNYCHRDLKPENILYDPEHTSPAQTVKIVDFGLCTKATTPDDPMLHDFCGSPGFFAPEILLCEQYDGRKADAWSLGCILLELVVGNDQFATLWMAMYELETLRNHAKFKALVHSSLDATRAYCHSDAWTYSLKLRSLLLSLLCENPLERPTITQVLDHAWFQSDTTASSRTKQVLPSCVSFSDGSSQLSLDLGAITKRPASAEHSLSDAGSPHVSVLLAATSPESARPPSPAKTTKVSLPSLSPEKPSGARSPDKTFGKRISGNSSQSPTRSRSSSRYDDDDGHS